MMLLAVNTFLVCVVLQPGHGQKREFPCSPKNCFAAKNVAIMILKDIFVFILVLTCIDDESGHFTRFKECAASSF